MRHALLACALIVAPFAAQAEDSAFNYTYADARYVHGDADAFSSNGNGVLLKGSFGFANDLFVFGDGRYFKTDHSNSASSRGSVESSDGRLGLGVHYPITPMLDAVGAASSVYTSVKGKFEVGFGLEAGLRIALAPMVEVRGVYNYQEVNSDDTSFFDLEGEYKFTPNYSAVASVIHGASADGYTVGARYNF